MSIHDNKYWSRRVEELATQISPTDDTTFFGSDAYREYTEDAAKNMVSGVCTYAYLKIAQRLDDMMQTAGLKVTRTGGLDIAGELRNTAMNTVAAAGAAVSAARVLYSGTKKIGAVGGKAIDSNTSMPYLQKGI